MNIEIDEKVIQDELQQAVGTVISSTVKRITSSYHFEEEIRGIVKKNMSEVITNIIAEQDIEEVRSMVRAAMIKSIKSKLERAIKAHDKEQL